MSAAGSATRTDENISIFRYSNLYSLECRFRWVCPPPSVNSRQKRVSSIGCWLLSRRNLVACSRRMGRTQTHDKLGTLNRTMVECPSRGCLVWYSTTMRCMAPKFGSLVSNVERGLPSQHRERSDCIHHRQLEKTECRTARTERTSRSMHTWGRVHLRYLMHPPLDMSYLDQVDGKLF